METELNKRSTSIRDYRLRPVSLDDLHIILGIINAFSQHFMGVNEIDEGELRNFLTSPDLNMAQDLRLLLSPEGVAVGYVECTLTDDPPVHPFIYLRVLPEYLDSQIPEHLMAWANEHAHSALAMCPLDLRISVQTFNAVEAVPMAKLFHSHGFQIIRASYQMWIDLDKSTPAPGWPQDIELRPFVEAQHIEALYRAYDQSFSDHFGYVKRPCEIGLKRFRHMVVEDAAHDPTLCFVAWDGDQVAGFSLCYKDSSEDVNMGWLGLLGVPRPWRNRGLGKALLLLTFEEFRKRGKTRVGLGVDASNLTGALALYENVGMYVARRYDRYEKELKPGKELMTTELS
ncbi:MAG: GNAT family N-acetyltransferase [Anaerolineales bacterium]